MKTRKKISARLLVIMLIAALLLPLAWNVPVEAAEAKQIDVLFSHDTHSHLNSFSTIVDGEQKDVGGFARIKTLIDEKKQEESGYTGTGWRRFFNGNPDSDRIRNGSGRT